MTARLITLWRLIRGEERRTRKLRGLLELLRPYWVRTAGMFVVEEKSSGKFAGRVGPWRPPGWPGFEVGWGIAKEFRGKGYAVEAARASIDWSFATYDIDVIVHCIDGENVASQGVARRLGARRDREIELFGHAADVWVTKRETWKVHEN